MSFVLEVCVDSVESAVSAARGGATRLELCANLVIGGTSPDEDLFLMVREAVDIPVRVLLRPRFGDFLYTDAEFELLRRQVRRFAARGADGVVIGILRPRFLHRGSGPAARAGRGGRERAADPDRRRGQRGRDPRAPAPHRRARLPSLRQAHRGQPHGLPPRGRADGPARHQRVRGLALRGTGGARRAAGARGALRRVSQKKPGFPWLFFVYYAYPFSWQPSQPAQPAACRSS